LNRCWVGVGIFVIMLFRVRVMAANGAALGVGGGTRMLARAKQLADLYKCFCEPSPPLMPNAMLSAGFNYIH